MPKGSGKPPRKRSIPGNHKPHYRSITGSELVREIQERARKEPLSEKRIPILPPAALKQRKPFMDRLNSLVRGLVIQRRHLSDAHARNDMPEIKLAQKRIHTIEGSIATVVTQINHIHRIHNFPELEAADYVRPSSKK